MTEEQEREHRLLLRLVRYHYEDDDDGFKAACQQLAKLYDEQGRRQLSEWVRSQYSD